MKMAELNIDATNAIAGRLASYVAKQALLGNSVNVFNCEKAVISGRLSAVRDKYYHRIFKTGRVFKGPFISRMPDRFVRRMIRGMVEHKQGRGKEAFDRIMCYIGVPAEFKERKLVKVAKQADELPKLKYQTVGDLCTSLGGRV
jgi:large subunit ribosomal protein L13